MQNVNEQNFLREPEVLFTKYGVVINYDDCTELGSGEFSGNQIKIVSNNHVEPLSILLEDICFE